ncbi:MAG: HlyD family efflux transporter periplasmic adaptor subunit [Deltaproteobacteria bacterium]|nr:HlyD family efflux transporter periplasmic adaptor subunit [Deltaproteobacteria bacterium]
MKNTTALWLSRAVMLAVLWLLSLVLGCAPQQAPTDELQGTVELHERQLSFEVPGRVTQLLVTRGQRVTKGQPIAALDDVLERPQRAAREADVKAAEAQLSLLLAGARAEDVKAAEAQLRGADAVLSTSRDTVDRLKALADHATQAQLDDAQGAMKRATAERDAAEQRLLGLRSGARASEVRAAHARVEGARAALALVEERLQKYRLVAPMDGVVLDTHVEPGEVAAAGAPIATLGEPRRPDVDLFVPEARAGTVRIGQKVSVRSDSSTGIAGVVEDVGRRTEFTPRYLYSPRERPNLVVRVRVALEDPQESLRAGVPAFAMLQGDRP